MAKLVRDKIPEIKKQEGENPKTHIASEEEYWKSLKEKLHEEVSEFTQNEKEEELADILEVIDSICNFKKIDKTDLERIKTKKKNYKGGFEKRIILEDG